MNVADVGANIGYFTMLAASIVGANGVVTTVEANPDNARLIEASRRLNGFGHVRIANVKWDCNGITVGIRTMA
jgi:FkbM family methyltransferase